MPCADQRLLVRQCDVLAAADRRNGRLDADHSHDPGHHRVGLFNCRRGDDPFLAGKDSGPGISDPDRELLCLFFVPDRGDPGVEFPDLLLKKVDVGTCGDRLHPDIPVCPDDLQRLSPDGPCRTENSYLFHIGILFLLLYLLQLPYTSCPYRNSAKQMAGAVNSILSNRSSTPPWPGMISP